MRKTYDRGLALGTRVSTLRRSSGLAIKSHEEVASMVFSVPVDKVTKEQRRVIKSLRFSHLYGSLMFCLLILSIPYQAQAQSADSIFENNYSRSTRDACRKFFRTPEERLQCAMDVTKENQRDLLEASVIRANNAQAERDEAITNEINDYRRRYRRKR